MGATGDLSQRKLLPGLFHLSTAGFIPGCRIIGVSLDDLDADGFRAIAREALDRFSARKVKEAVPGTLAIPGTALDRGDSCTWRRSQQKL